MDQRQRFEQVSVVSLLVAAGVTTRSISKRYLVGVAALGKPIVPAGGLDFLRVINCLVALFLGIVLVELIVIPCIVDILTAICRRSMRVLFLANNI